MKLLLSIVAVAITCAVTQCQPKDQSRQDKPAGGACEGCAAVYEYGEKSLNAIDTLPDFTEAGQRIQISGTIYQKDGKTPAADVILYIYHTDQQGEYATRGDERGWGKRHGSIRGWVKTGKDGKYTFYTLVPGAYPGGGNPRHIHPIVKEPGYEAYWIDEYLFDDDPILTARERASQQKRGGNGIVKTTQGANGMLLATRDIILGLNLEGYD
ncbi:MAG TPA: intradiol ring-cleavage dioxygenase [Chryseosolibacter sp.]|nr:intradiol ring-cleavage dioxygenase [Chryseosolibacter sp.]